jgi:tRNA A-37 threonylcarbamoyl transferase component Bud32
MSVGDVIGGLFGAAAVIVAIIVFCYCLQMKEEERRKNDSEFMRSSAVPLVTTGMSMGEQPNKQMLYTSKALPTNARQERKQKPKLYTTPPQAPTLAIGVAEEDIAAEAAAARDSTGSRLRMMSESALGDPTEVEFGEKLAQGGAAAVYRGTYQYAPVAIKKLLKGQGKNNTDEKEIKLMQDEAYLMSKLRHPNIVQFYCLLKHEDQLCLVMELMTGGCFREMIDDGKEMSLALKLKIIWQSSKGLAYLHTLQRPIIHRDMKAANILLDERLEAKVTDFGISRITSGAQHGLTSFSGTVAWMAPELLNAQATYNKQVDVYSLGMTIFEALTHEVPFNGMHMGQIVMTVVHDVQRPQLWQTATGAEQAAQDLMVRCWAQLPEDRPPIQQVVSDLDAVMKLAQQEEGKGK